VYIGNQVIVAGLSRDEASTLVDAYRRHSGGTLARRTYANFEV
jgi:hypothetical protein